VQNQRLGGIAATLGQGPEVELALV